MSEQNFFNELKKEQGQRIASAIRKAKETVLLNRFPPFQNASIEKIKKHERLLNQLEGLLTLATDSFFEHLSSPLKKIKSRSNWEVYLSGLQYLFRKYPQGCFRQTNLALKEFDDLPDKTDAYSYKCLEGFCDIADLAEEIKKYCENYEKAREIIQQYKNWEGNKNMAKLYASLKTWSQDTELQVFENCFHKAEKQVFEIIMTGPIQLYLMISQETWFSVLKILTVESLEDFHSNENEKEIDDLKKVNESIYKAMERSTTYRTFKRLAQESLKIYVDNYLKIENQIRAECPTDELKRKFIRRFETGELFR